MSDTSNEPWGKVDEHLNVFVREGDTWREVGQFADSTPEEALAYYERKYQDLAGAVTLLEARIARGTATGDVQETVDKLTAQLAEPAAVGDIAALRERVAKLSAKAGELTEKQRAERDAQRAQAIADREALVVEAERLAAQPESQIRWKDTNTAFEQLFSRWQEAQRSGASVPKATADALWKRFRSARSSFESARRAHFAQLDSENKNVKLRKEQLIAAAKALAPKGADGITAYRKLLDEWKSAGRASRKIDDQLWAQFKAAGDVLYQAKAEEMAVTNEEFAANLALKEQLIAEHSPNILGEKDHVAARNKLTILQTKYDEIGRVPREAIREIEGKLRNVEDHVKSLEEQHWQATNPETQARSEGLRGQLEQSIAALEQEIAGAKDAKTRKAAEEKLATQQSWLKALG